jgi:hypothetical protein
VDLLKKNIEGAERLALSGMGEMLRRPIIFAFQAMISNRTALLFRFVNLMRGATSEIMCMGE